MADEGDRWRALLADASVCVRAPSAALAGILTDGRVKSLFETGTSRAYAGVDARRDAEAVLFGCPRGGPDRGRPVYGYVDGTCSRSSEAAVSGYGDCKLMLRASTRTRTTVLAFDSLAGVTQWEDQPLAAPELIGEVTHRSLVRPLGRRAGSLVEAARDSHPRPFAFGYVEAHIHGGVEVADVEAVRFDSPARVDPRLLEALRAAGIRAEDRDGHELG